VQTKKSPSALYLAFGKCVVASKVRAQVDHLDERMRQQRGALRVILVARSIADERIEVPTCDEALRQLDVSRTKMRSFRIDQLSTRFVLL
jgi:RNase H-fold protein (predicted Holliday junction resolvase)